MSEHLTDNLAEGLADAFVPRVTPYHRSRILLSLATLVALALFYAAARLLRIPPTPDYSISLLQQSSPVLALVVVLILLILSAIVGSIIAGSIRQDAGLVTAALGLVAMTGRGGTITATLHAATSPNVYSTLAVETALLYAFLVLAWFALAPLRSSQYLTPDHLHDNVSPPSAEDEPIGNKLLATAATTLGTLILLLILAQTPDKAQSLFSVFLAALIATAAAHSAFPVQPSVWYWVGPGLVGVIGYAYASASPGPWLIGVPATPLASPLPLDYAAAGPAGAIMGYWMSRKWQQARESTITPPPPPSHPTTDAHMPLG
jgi:hypothetical protein